MRVRLSGAAVAVFALVVVGCGDQQSRLPEQPNMPPPSFAPPSGGGFSTNCSFPTANQLAGSYFTNNDTARVVRGLITDMKSAGARTPAARGIGFDVFEHVSKNVTANPDEATGSALVNEIIKCMFSDANAWPATYTAAIPGPEDFTVSLDATLNGAFEVRSSTIDNTPVRARLDSYSAVAPSQLSSWSSVLSTNPAPNRVLFYGRPSIEQVGVNPKTFYNWKVVARNTIFDPALLVGVCLDAFENQKAMVRRQDQISISFLPFADAWFLEPGDNCEVHTANQAAPWQQLAQGAFRFGTELLGPRPLAASAVVNPGGLGGSTGGIRTDYGPEVVDSVFLRFVDQPHDARVCPAAVCAGSQTISPFTVIATWHGFAVGGVRVTVVPIDNNGTTVALLGAATLVTGEDGTVTYTDLGLTKPGGYRLVTNAELVVSRSADIVVPHVESTRFNIRP